MLLSLVLCGSLSDRPANGQGSLEDYERAGRLRELTRDKVFRDRVDPVWIEGESRFWYRVKTDVQSHRFVLVDADQATKQPAFHHARLADALSTKLGTRVEPKQLPFAAITVEDGQIEFTVDGKTWVWNDETRSLQELSDAGGVSDSLPSLTSIERSRDGGDETYLTFVNETEHAVRLRWVDGRGRRHDYGQVEPGGEYEQHTFAGHVWLVEARDGRPLAAFRATKHHARAVVDGQSELDVSEEPTEQETDVFVSPDGKWSVHVEDHNLVLTNVETSEAIHLTDSGTEVDAFAGRIVWAPDSSKFVAMQERAGEGREIHMIESAPEDQLQPKLHKLSYAKPGDKLPIRRPRLFDVGLRKQIEIDESLFPNPWRIGRVRWRSDSGEFSFLYNQRGHQVLRIVSVDAQTGAARPVVDEQNATFIDYAHKTFMHHVEGSQEIIWMSERDGWNHLYLYDAETGKVKNQITEGDWVIRGVERVDDDLRRIWFRASGVYPEQDPYYIHYGYVDFDGSSLTILTRGNGTHEVDVSPDGNYIVDRYSRVDMPTVTELRDAHTGELVCELERGDWSSLVVTGWKPPERFVAKGRDGETDIYGVIYRPTNFDPEKTFPVIEKIYAGPHGSFVPKSFSSFRRVQTYAELGFILVQIDGMGTSHRSKAFHDVCWKNLGDSGFPDRILWMKAAAKKYPQLDITRVGIYGGSAGGQSALRALLAHGDFYKVAVSDCGCHDNRMDKVWWNELWMGWPIGPHYEEQSNVTQAHRLTGKLFLTVGELDRNVDPASTMQVVDALIKAEKDFDLLVVPGAGHGVGESPYANRRRQDFFVRHLWGKEPRL